MFAYVSLVLVFFFFADCAPEQMTNALQGDEAAFGSKKADDIIMPVISTIMVILTGLTIHRVYQRCVLFCCFSCCCCTFATPDLNCVVFRHVARWKRANSVVGIAALEHTAAGGAVTLSDDTSL